MNENFENVTYLDFVQNWFFGQFWLFISIFQDVEKWDILGDFSTLVIPVHCSSPFWLFPRRNRGRKASAVRLLVCDIWTRIEASLQRIRLGACQDCFPELKLSFFGRFLQKWHRRSISSLQRMIQLKNDMSQFRKSCTVFENHRKSLIQHYERSELRLHFEWTKVN